MEENKALQSLFRLLSNSDRTIDSIRGAIIESAGRANRPYTEDEEWTLDRMERAKSYVAKALFEVRRSSFDSEPGNR